MADKLSKKGKKRMLRASIWIIVLIGCVYLLITVSKGTSETSDGDLVHVKIKEGNDLGFIDEENLQSRISSIINGLDTFQGLTKEALLVLEKDILKNPYVLSANLFEDVNGGVHATVSQRRPILRVINRNGVSYYVDESQVKIPVSPNFVYRTVIVTSAVDLDLKDTGAVQDEKLKNACLLATYIEKDQMLKDLVDQIHIDKQGTFYIVPKIDNNRIKLGTVDKLDEKFERLEIFYKQTLMNGTWGKYKTIDVQYSGQVVCERK